MKKKIVFGAVLVASILGSCNNETTEKPSNQDKNTSSEEVIVEEVEEEKGIHGVYVLTDMIPVTDGKVLTKQDEAYINDSKKRTLNNTTLTLNEDGTFERIFPHPSGNGSTNKWTGTYTLNEESGDMVFDVEMNGKKTKMDFSLVDQSPESLSLNSSFGQIFMTYVYSRK